MKTYSLSSAQKRLYYKVLLDSHDANLSITSAITICGEYVSDKLKSGIIQLFEQNPILRANFFFNKATHEILQQYSCDPVIISHRQEHLDADKIDEFIKKEAIKLQIKKSDLAIYPNYSIVLIDFNSNDSNKTSVIFLNFHHIICDDLSINLIIEQLIENYRASLLSETPKLKNCRSYFDFIEQEKIFFHLTIIRSKCKK